MKPPNNQSYKNCETTAIEYTHIHTQTHCHLVFLKTHGVLIHSCNIFFFSQVLSGRPTLSNECIFTKNKNTKELISEPMLN